MGAVQRVARLERHHPLPALLAKEGAGLLGAQNILAVLGVFGLRQDLDFTADQHFAWIGHGHAPAGMIQPAGLVDRFDVGLLIPGEDVIDPHDADRFARRVDQLDAFARLQRAGHFLGRGQRNGNRPGVLLPVHHDVHIAQHAIVDLFDHRARERAEAAVAESIDTGKVGVADRKGRQPGDFLAEFGFAVG